MLYMLNCRLVMLLCRRDRANMMADHLVGRFLGSRGYTQLSLAMKNGQVNKANTELHLETSMTHENTSRSVPYQELNMCPLGSSYIH
jgi:hypothetical protein